VPDETDGLFHLARYAQAGETSMARLLTAIPTPPDGKRRGFIGRLCVATGITLLGLKGPPGRE
jgi:hypothetical protein